MEVEPGLRRLVAGARWCALATIDADGEPFVSYVPSAPVAGGFGIVVSALAAHTAHLTRHARASLLLIGEAAADDDPFARPRLSIDAAVHAPGAARGAAIWDALAERNGATTRILRTLPDFRPLWLEPLRGRLVLGFAAARDVASAEIAAASA